MTGKPAGVTVMEDGGVGGYHDGQTRGCDSDGGRWCRRLP